MPTIMADPDAAVTPSSASLPSASAPNRVQQALSHARNLHPHSSAPPQQQASTSAASLDTRHPSPAMPVDQAPTPLPTDPLEARYFRVPWDELRNAWDVEEKASSSASSSSSRSDDSSSGPSSWHVRDSKTGTHQNVDLLGPYTAESEEDMRRLRRMIVQERRRTGKPVEDVVAGVMEREGRIRSVAQERELLERQTAEQQECYTGNENLSCYPTSSTDVNQNTWSKFIWNKNYPFFTNGDGYVDIYLFHQDSDQLFTSWTSISNDQGRISFQPNDDWWAGRSAADNIADGQTISWPFYFAITSHGAGLSDGTSRLATWHAVQTAVPATIAAARASSSSLASVASASSAASLSSAASAASVNSLTATLTGSALSSASASLQSESDAAASRSLAGSLSRSLQSSMNSEGLTGTETARGTATSTLADGHTVTAYATAQANGGNLNDNSNSSNTSIPHWAIVLIAVLGFLAVVAAAIAGYFLMRWLRRRRGYWAGAAVAGGGFGAGRMAASGSHGSQSPMMQAAGAAGGEEADGTSSLLAGTDGASYNTHDGGAGAAAATGVGAAAVGGAASSRRPRQSDPASQGEEEPSPFSTDEASKMAEAFRAALRKPAFALGLGAFGGGSNGADSSTPSQTAESGAGTGGEHSSHNNGPSDALLRDELASEGREMRVVDDRRRPSLHRPE